MKKLLLILFLFFPVRLNKVLVLEKVKVETPIKLKDITKADSIVALVMLMNREVPYCSDLEKLYWASCVPTGCKQTGLNWKTYVFKKKQFWNFNDERLNYDSIRDSLNFKIVKEAWKNPKPVMFYCGKYDTNSLHIKQVTRNSVTNNMGFHHLYSLTLK